MSKRRLSPSTGKRRSDRNNGYLDLRGDPCAWSFISRRRGKPFEISLGSARKSRSFAEGIGPSSPRQTTAGTTFGACAD